MSPGHKEGRDAILARVRRALAAPAPNGSVEQSVHGEGLPRGYRVMGGAPRKQTLERLLERLGDYGVRCRRATAAGLAATVERSLSERGSARLVVPRGLPEAWLPAGFEWLWDDGLPFASVSESDGVITACALAIAETGTIVLDGGPDQGRRAISLLPDYHLCLVREEQVVELVPEAVGSLHGAVSRGVPITFISGPSATSDIELKRVEGVHGPRTLEVILVGAGDGPREGAGRT